MAEQIRRGSVRGKEELGMTPVFLAKQLEGLKCC